MQALLFPLIIVVMFGFMIYSQRRQAKQQQERLSQIKKGDEVVTIGGLHGVIDEIDEITFVLDCDGVYLTFERGAIRHTVTKAPQEAPVSAIETAEE